MNSYESEKTKYDSMHEIPGYSPGPGIAHVKTALGYIKPGDSVIDFGCGTGDAAQAFIDLGHSVQAVDISAKGLRRNLGERFSQASLIALPDLLKPASWGFCCDVMEHLPTEWIDQAFLEISRKVQNCFFSISGDPDSWGRKIGSVLHLTVRPVEWWGGRIRGYWTDVNLIHNSGSTFIFVAKGAKRV